MIIYTCPKCGEDLFHYIITTYPPIPVYECLKCGWKYEDISNSTITRVPLNLFNIPEK